MTSNLRLGNEIAEAALCFNQVRTQFAPQPPHKDFDCVAVRFLVAKIDVFGQYTLGNDLTLVMKQVAEQPEFQWGDLDPPPVHRDPHLQKIELQITNTQRGHFLSRVSAQ